MIGYEKISKRLGAAKNNKKNWESHLDECYDYALPERSVVTKKARGSKVRTKIFDDTAVEALEDYANRMSSQLVPAGSNWMKLASGSDIPKEQKDEVNIFLEESTETTFSHIHSSNFQSQVSEAFLDLGVSTGCLLVEPGDGIQSSLNFRSIPLPELICEKSSRGIIETVWREFKVPVKDIKENWPAAKLTATLEQTLQDKPETEIDLVEGIVKVKDGEYQSVLMYPKEKDFLYNFLMDYNPYVVFRESTMPGETYGRGRVMKQLNNIKTLNAMMEDYLKGLSVQANPMFTATDDGIINPSTIRIKPGAIIPVGSNDNANPTLRSLQVSSNPQLLEFAVRGLQDTIRKSFLSKPFGNIEDTPVRSATEMSMRNAELASASLASSSRIQSELLERIVSNCVNILKKAGKLPDFRVNGREVKIKFVNPATRQQDESTLAAYSRFIEIAQAFPPEMIMQNIKVDMIPEEIAQALGLPNKVVRTASEKMQIQQQQQMAAQQQMAMEQGGQQ